MGRHPRSLLGQFKTELFKRVARIENYDELYRLIENDKDLRTLCDIKEGEKPYPPSTLSRFRKRIGPEAFQQIMTHCVKQLDRMNVLDARTVALDATFIEAYSRRDPKNSRRGLSDIEAGLRKQEGNVTLGYGVHLAADTKSEMPLAAVVESANVNEKKAAPTLPNGCFISNSIVEMVLGLKPVTSASFFNGIFTGCIVSSLIARSFCPLVMVGCSNIVVSRPFLSSTVDCFVGIR